MVHSDDGSDDLNGDNNNVGSHDAGARNRQTRQSWFGDQNQFRGQGWSLRSYSEIYEALINCYKKYDCMEIDESHERRA